MSDVPRFSLSRTPADMISFKPQPVVKEVPKDSSAQESASEFAPIKPLSPPLPVPSPSPQIPLSESPSLSAPSQLLGPPVPVQPVSAEKASD